VFVSMRASTPCLLCGYRVAVLMCATARVNKRSMKVGGPLLGGFAYHRCPECQTPVDGELMPRSAYRLYPEDNARVIAYRERRWGITSAGTGLLVEAGRR
jgi:hypothetical protein